MLDVPLDEVEERVQNFHHRERRAKRPERVLDVPAVRKDDALIGGRRLRLGRPRRRGLVERAQVGRVLGVGHDAVVAPQLGDLGEVAVGGDGADAVAPAPAIRALKVPGAGVDRVLAVVPDHVVEGGVAVAVVDDLTAVDLGRFAQRWGTTH